MKSMNLPTGTKKMSFSLFFPPQWVMGFTVFLLPCTPMAARALIKPAHVWMGGIILVLSIVSCISGINEKLFFAL